MPSARRQRDLEIENYLIGYLKHPYISLYAGRRCKSRCTFCLWPKTVGGHRYRTGIIEHVVEEIRWAKQAFPQNKEIVFDDASATVDREHRRRDFGPGRRFPPPAPIAVVNPVFA